MAWTNSKIGAQTILDLIDDTSDMDIDADTFKIALYNNSITPDNTAAAASFAYNAGQFANSNEVDDGTNWDAGGETVPNVDATRTAAVITIDGDNTSQGGVSTTLADVYGHLFYDDTVASPVADQGWSYNYYGGVQSVTAGTFTVQHHASGIMALTLT